ncbi:MAG: DEAD/DEAH box helicase family protein [Candidatus Nitrosopolaris sp.]
MLPPPAVMFIVLLMFELVMFIVLLMLPPPAVMFIVFVIQKAVYCMRNSFDVNTNSKEVISPSAISKLTFPFHLKGHQLEAVDAWISSGLRGSIIYSSGTGKTEIAFECTRRAADISSTYSSMKILLLVPRIVLIAQYLKRLLNYVIPRGNACLYRTQSFLDSEIFSFAGSVFLVSTVCQDRGCNNKRAVITKIM